MRVYLIFIHFFWIAAQIQGEDLPYIAVDFEEWETGEINKFLVEQSFGEVIWEKLNGRARVAEAEEGKVLQVQFPKGGVGSKDSGAQFVTAIPSQRITTLRYRVRARPGFDFMKGGKLPGLSSGESQFTGGRPPGKRGGWSARYMWRREGAVELYFYHPGMEGQFGERHVLGVHLTPGRWMELAQRIDTGEPGDSNGSIRVDVDGETKLEIEGLEFHGSEYGPVDSFLFHTFYGGSSKSWAPPKETRLEFDDFAITSETPGDKEE